jgi:branched-chain amino acid transport system ATP-binding protein
MQSPEGRFVLAGLTVEENLRVGAYQIKSKAELERNFKRVYTLFPRLKERAKQQSSTLSGGEQQMLAIGRALMGSPKLLILDEPSLGLAPLLIKDIFETLKKIKAEGTTILIVEQNALATLKIADYAYVLELGKISMHGRASDLLKDKRLIEAYLGGK